MKDAIFKFLGFSSKVVLHAFYLRQEIYEEGERAIAEGDDQPGDKRRVGCSAATILPSEREDLRRAEKSNVGAGGEGWRPPRDVPHVARRDWPVRSF